MYIIYTNQKNKYKLLFAEGSISKGIEQINGSFELNSSFRTIICRLNRWLHINNRLWKCQFGNNA